ncbi:MAG TPA: hypothetical protein VF575_03015 [Candidatus Saccharimonadales bacterium]
MTVLLLAAAVPFLLYSSSNAAQLSFRQLQLSDATVSSTDVKYNFSFNTNTSNSIGSVAFEICDNYQYEQGDPCTPPAGFDASNATLSGQTGIADFTLNPASTGNKLILSRSVSLPASPQQLTMEFSDITNPSTIGSSYVRISTFVTTDASGPETDYGIVVYATTEGIGITTEVPPYLLFCTGITIDGYDCSTAAGNFISFGELSSQAPRSATSQMLASTNAAYGYSVTLAGTTMTAGNNVIPAMTGGASQRGTNQFGVNARQNVSPAVGSEPNGPGLINPANGYNTPNIFKFNSGDIVASSSNADDYRKLTMSYIVNVGSNQPPGRYVATVSYICLANF